MTNGVWFVCCCFGIFFVVLIVVDLGRVINQTWGILLVVFLFFFRFTSALLRGKRSYL